MVISAGRTFVPLTLNILTISDSRDENTDKSGNYLRRAAIEAGHSVKEKLIVKDDRYQIRAHLSRWIADEQVQAVITTGGTGFSHRDITPEAIGPLLDKTIPGFGELFRSLSLAQIGTSTVQSRAFGGQANDTFIFALPGSLRACQLGWEEILKQQLDYSHQPCNFVELLPNIEP